MKCYDKRKEKIVIKETSYKTILWIQWIAFEYGNCLYKVTENILHGSEKSTFTSGQLIDSESWKSKNRWYIEPWYIITLQRQRKLSSQVFILVFIFSKTIQWSF